MGNYLRSIKLNSEFVEATVDRYRAQNVRFPLWANLRNGKWYGPSWDGAAYFKSTDGHSRHWAFSPTRLNLHFARSAAQHGGCFLVDSTRRGKAFPDSLTATLPIWCAVINRVVGGEREGAWDGDVHLPPWLSASEAAQIADRIETFVEALSATTRAQILEQLGPRLEAPLRAIWLSPASHILLDATSSGSGAASEHCSDEPIDMLPGAAPDLAFTPVICISASAVQSAAEHRQYHRYTQLPLPWRRNPGPPRTAPADLEPPRPNPASNLDPDPDPDNDPDPDPDLTVVLPAASWTYIQGAGDDEENWSCGLTPGLFWANCEELLVLQNEAGLQARIDELVASGGAAADNVAAAEVGSAAQSGGRGPRWIGTSRLCYASTAWVDTRCGPGPSDAHHRPFGFLLHCDPEPLPWASSLAEGTYLHIPVAAGKRANAFVFWESQVLPEAIRFAHRTLLAKKSENGAAALMVASHDSATAATVLCALLFALYDDDLVSLVPGVRTQAASKDLLRGRLVALQPFLPEEAWPPRHLMKVSTASPTSMLTRRQ